jgi:hypothetical protein
MENEPSATIDQGQPMAERLCAYSRCRKPFTPKVEWQTHCIKQHRYLAYQERRFNRAVEQRLREIESKNAH